MGDAVLKRYAAIRAIVEIDSCSQHELTRFAKDRRIDLNGAKSKKTIIIALSQADDVRMFKNFMELPPELRNRVYDWYLAPFPRKLTLPSVPPLARASKQLKSEVQPLFLATKAMGLVFERKSESMTRASPHIKPTSKTDLFFVHHVKEDLSEVRRFFIEVRQWWPRSGGGEDYTVFCTVTIVPDRTGTGYDVTVGGDMDCEQSKRVAKREMLFQELSGVMNEVAKRETRKKLTVKDIYALRTSMEVMFG